MLLADKQLFAQCNSVFSPDWKGRRDLDLKSEGDFAEFDEIILPCTIKRFTSLLCALLRALSIVTSQIKHVCGLL